MFIKKKIYKTACKETWSVAKPGVATDYAGHTGFFWQESVLLFHSRPKASTNFQPDLVFQRLTWLGPSRPFCSSEIRKYRPTSSYHAVPVGRRNKMLERTLATLNASSPIMSHALEQINAARIGVICQGASSAPHFLHARLQGYSFQFVFRLVLPAYTLHLPSICVLPTAFKTFCSNKLGILTGRSWHFSDISRLITPVAPNFRQKSWNQYNCPLHARK